MANKPNAELRYLEKNLPITYNIIPVTAPVSCRGPMREARAKGYAALHTFPVHQGYTSCSSSTPLLFYLERATSGPANYVPGS